MTTTQPRSVFFSSQGLRLHYLDWGNAGAPVLVLLHGGRDHARSWDRVAAALSVEFHVVAPDMRGHGDSDWSPDGAYDIPYLLCDLAALLATLGSGPVLVVAHSYGATVALRYAGIHPGAVSRMVAIEGLRGVAPDVAESGEQAAARWRKWIAWRNADETPRAHATLEQAASHMAQRNSGFAADWVRHLTEHGTRCRADGSYAWKFDPRVRHESPGDISDAELHALWGQIDCPLLLAYGRQSWARDPREDGRMRHFRRAQVTVFEDAGHWLHHQHLAAFVSLARGFLVG